MKKRGLNVVPKNIDKLKGMIKESGVSLNGFCEKSGVSHPTMDKILYKNHNPYPPVAKKIAKALGVDISEIFFTNDVQK